MSRRKDRDRFTEMQRLDPDYRGFRGYGQEPTRAGNTPLETLTCSVCGRRRNVPAGIALEHGDKYVCLSCSEEAEGEPEKEPLVS